jgi:hypothetical protein
MTRIATCFALALCACSSPPQPQEPLGDEASREAVSVPYDGHHIEVDGGKLTNPYNEDGGGLFAPFWLDGAQPFGQE